MCQVRCQARVSRLMPQAVVTHFSPGWAAGTRDAAHSVQDDCSPSALPTQYHGHTTLLVPSFVEQVADWEELRRRKDLDLLQAYPAAGLHPSTFVPTNPVAPVGADGGAGAAATTMPLPLPLAMVPAGAAMGVVGVPGGMPLVPALPTAAPMPLPSAEPRGGVRTVGKVTKASKQKAGGRTFTSKYRGVHQTFPTRRWEAQFRWAAPPAAGEG